MRDSIMDTVSAYIGDRAAELRREEALPGTEICEEKGIPYYPRLGLRANALALRIVLPEEEGKLLWELMKAAGLRKPGWRVRSLREPGARRLWGLVIGLMRRSPALPAIEPMSGMTPEDRGHFADLLRWCGERGLSVSYTASKLKDVMELDVPQRLCFYYPEGWRETDTARLKAQQAITGGSEDWNELQRRMEGGALG